MPESSEGQQPSPVEQTNRPPWKPEFGPEAMKKLEKGDIIGYMDAENKKYLWENAETPEIAEQLIEVYENAKKLKENVAKFSKDDPNIPASEETKQKLIDLTHVDTEDGSSSMSVHELALKSSIISLIGGGLLEVMNYTAGLGGHPGLGAEIGLAMGAALGGSIEGYALVKKGAEKLTDFSDT